MKRLRIAPHFFQKLRTNRNLSEDAFISACGLTAQRYKELQDGAEPTMREICNITVGFQLTDGIPMSIAVTDAEQRLASDVTQPSTPVGVAA